MFNASPQKGDKIIWTYNASPYLPSFKLFFDFPEKASPLIYFIVPV